MKQFDAFFLPIPIADAQIRTLQVGDVEVRWPALNKLQLREVHFAVSSSRQRLLATSVAEIVNAIDKVAVRLQGDISSSAGLISQATGYSEPVVRETLEHMFADWRAEALNEMLRGELPDPAILDAPIPDPDIPNKQIAVYGYPAVFHVFSGNVPGVAVTSIVRSLLVKSASIGKLASGEPVLPILFARALQDVAPHIASCIALSYWPGENSETNATAAELCDAVVIYGGEAAVQSIREAAGIGKHLVVHGPRLSFGMVGQHPNASDIEQIAHAVAAYDQQGCVSPHLVYVHDKPDNARRLAASIASELERVAQSLPRGQVSADEAVAIRNARTAAEFTDNAEVFGAEKAGFSVIYEEDPTFRISCLNRVLYVKPLGDITMLSSLLPRATVLQSVALAGFDKNEKAELVSLLGLSGVSRITTFERLPWPPMHWHHDGSAPLRELIRWQDIELD